MTNGWPVFANVISFTMDKILSPNVSSLVPCINKQHSAINYDYHSFSLQGCLKKIRKSEPCAISTTVIIITVITLPNNRYSAPTEKKGIIQT